MRKFLFSVLLTLSAFLFSATLFGQDWVETWQSDQTTFQQKQQAFENHFSGKDLSQTKGWKQFKRWEYYFQRFMGTNADFAKTKEMALQRFLENRNGMPARTTAEGNWTFIGPSTTPTNGGGAGRVTNVEFIPGSNDLYIGAPNGGIWKRTGTNWASNTDNLSFLGFSDIAINPLNTNEMYAATGDGDAGDARCIGVLKSTDGGATWNSVGITGVTRIYKLITASNDFNKVIATTSNGIYVSTNGGTSWTNPVSGGSVYDIEFMPGSTTTIYGVSANKFFISTNGGTSFTENTTGGLPTTGANRRAIAVTPANANYVYLIIGRSDNSGFHSFWRSTDGGTTFTMMLDGTSSGLNLLGWSSVGTDVSAGGQSWYDLSIAASPTDANVVFTGGVNIWRTLDGGTNWGIYGHWTGSGAAYVHADIHNLDFNQATGTLYASTDGGLFQSTNVTGASNWTDISNGLQIAQMYRLGAAQTDDGLVITGWQDNGTNLRQGAINNWRRVIGGDGMESAIDPSNASIMMGEIYYGRISRSVNGGTNWSTMVASGGTAGTVNENGPWVTNYVIAKSNTSVYYVGKTNVYKSINSGSSWASSTGIPSSGQISGLAVAPTNENYVYASKGSSLYVSTDGSSFVNRSAGLPGITITYIAVHAVDPAIAWVTLAGFTSGQKVYKTTDAGQTWTNVTGSLPNTAVNCIAVHETGPLNQTYIGTETGVYYKNDTMSAWIEFDNGLPNTEVAELEIVYSASKIKAATYGRGAWESPLYTSTANCSAAVPVANFSANAVNICVGQTISYTNTSTNCQSTYTWNFTGGTPATSNAVSPTVTYNAAGTYNVSLTVTNPGGTDTKTINGYITVNTTLAHTASISTPTTDICASQTATFTLTNANAGSTPTITWLRNGLSIPGTTGQTTVNLSGLANGDVITVSEVTSAGCATPSSVVSNAVTMQVSPNVTHTVSIATPKTQLCLGETATFTMTAANAGTTPAITWYKNGVAIPGTSGQTSITITPANGDVISVTENSTAKCVSPVSVTSNSIALTVTPTPAKPVITQVVGDLQSSAAAGNQWFRNTSSLTGATNTMYRPLFNGSYQVQVTINGCAGPISEPFNLVIEGVSNLRPVPTSGQVTFDFYAPEASNKYQVTVYNSIGQLVHRENGSSQPGLNQLSYNWDKLAAGIYTVRLKVGNTEYKKRLLVQ